MCSFLGHPVYKWFVYVYKKFADCSMFANDAKLSGYVSNPDDSTDLQKGFCALKE